MKSEGDIIELIKTLSAEGGKIPIDLKKLFESAKKGIIPEKSELASLAKIFPFLNIQTKIVGIKFLIKEYEDFIGRLGNECPTLLREELEDSKLRVFDKNIDPLKLPQKKYGKELEGIFNYLDIGTKFSQLTNLLTELIDSDSNSIDKTINTLDLGEIKEKNLIIPKNILEKTKKLLKNQIKPQELQEEMNKLFNSRNYPRSLRKESKEKFSDFFESISDLVAILGESKNDPNI